MGQDIHVSQNEHKGNIFPTVRLNMILKQRSTKPNNTTEIKWRAFVKYGKKILEKTLKTYLYEFKIGRRLKYSCQITQKPVENEYNFYRQIVCCKLYLKFKHIKFC